MGRLAKNDNGTIRVVHRRVASPDYTLFVDDYSTEGHVQDGWTYYADDVETEDFVADWKQPEGAHDAYDIGATVLYNDIVWRSTIIANVWQPGVSGWVDASSDTPAWLQPTGAHDAYAKDAVVSHGGKTWKSLLDANVWQPGVANWRANQLILPSGEPVPPDWVQPTGAQDAYQLGDRVTHNGQVWASTINANVWEPGVVVGLWVAE
jgi:hypothetical protein